jgi:hypothetical protein
MPELHWRLGYAYSWALIIGTTILQLLFFRGLGWIGGQPMRAKLPPLRSLDPRSLAGRRRPTS